MKEIDLNRLMIFKVVVLTGSFSKAGNQLKMPKSRISRQISALELELGVPLIYRTTRSFQLTQAGKDLFQRAMPALTDLESVLQNLGDQNSEMQGSIRFTVPEDVGVEVLAGLCHEFQLSHPRVLIDVIVDNRRVDLVKEGVDLALRMGKIKDSTLMAKKIGEVSLGIYAGANLFGRFAKPGKLEDLSLLPFLSFSGADEQRILFSGPKNQTVMKLKPVFNCNNFFTLKKMAMLGNGFTLLPCYLVKEEAARGDIIHLFKDWSAETVPVQLVYPPQKNMPPRLRSFIDFMSRRLAEKVL